MPRVSWRGRGLEGGKGRAGNHYRKLCWGEAEPVAGLGTAAGTDAPCSPTTLIRSTENNLRDAQGTAEPVLSTDHFPKSFSFNAGYVSGAAAQPAGFAFGGCAGELRGEGGSRRPPKAGLGGRDVLGCSGRAWGAAGPAPQWCDAPSVSPGTLPLPN